MFWVFGVLLLCFDFVVDLVFGLFGLFTWFRCLLCFWLFCCCLFVVVRLYCCAVIFSVLVICLFVAVLICSVNCFVQLRLFFWVLIVGCFVGWLAVVCRLFSCVRLVLDLVVWF